MFYKKQMGRHAVVIVLATIPAMSAHGVQVIYLPPMLSAPDSDAAALYRSGCQSLEAGDTSGANAISFLSQTAGEFAIDGFRLLEDANTTIGSLLTEAQNELVFGRAGANALRTAAVAKAGKALTLIKGFPQTKKVR